MKISIPTATHSSARDTRGVSIDASSTRFVRKGGSPCRLSQLTCSVFLFYFRRFLFCARHATPHVPPPPPTCPSALAARPRVPVIPVRSPHFVLITSHRQPGRARLSALPRDNAAQLLIALPISARARSRSTSPAAGLQQTNACPIINCHDPLIGSYASLRRLFSPAFPFNFSFFARKKIRPFQNQVFHAIRCFRPKKFYSRREFDSVDRISLSPPP